MDLVLENSLAKLAEEVVVWVVMVVVDLVVMVVVDLVVTVDLVVMVDLVVTVDLAVTVAEEYKEVQHQDHYMCKVYKRLLLLLYQTMPDYMVDYIHNQEHIDLVLVLRYSLDILLLHNNYYYHYTHNIQHKLVAYNTVQLMDQ